MNGRMLFLPLAAVVAAAALPGGVAVAADQSPGEATMIYRYAITVEGSADYARHDQEPSGNGVATEDANLHFGWTAQIPMMQFFGHLPTGGAGPIEGEPTVAVDYRRSIPEAEYTDIGSCDGGRLDAGASSLTVGSEMTADHRNTIDVTVLGAESVKLSDCSGALEHLDASLPLGTNLAEDGRDPWTTTFDLPNEAIGQGKIIQLLDHTATGVDCPGHKPTTTSCTLTWHARLTFVKTSEELEVLPTDDGSLFVPLPPASGTAPTPTTTPASARPVAAPVPSLDEVLRAAARQASLAAGGASAIVPVTCPAGCSGTATATAIGAKAARAAAVKTLGRASFALKPGATKRVTLRFSTAARRAIRRAGGVRIALRLATPGGRPQGRTLVVRLRGR